MQATPPARLVLNARAVCRIFAALAVLGLVSSTAWGAPENASADCPDTGSESIRGYRVFANPVDYETDSAGLVAELRSRGVRDLYSVKSGDHAGEVALGFFQQRGNAEARVTKLEDLGFRVYTVVLTRDSRSADCRQAARSDDRSASSPVTPPPENSSDAGAGETETAPLRNESAQAPENAEPRARQTTATAGPSRDCTTTATSYIVLANPAENGNDTLALVYQLRAKGIDNLFVVTAEKHKGQVALGIYDNQQQAREREEELTAMGFSVRSEAQGQGTSNCP